MSEGFDPEGAASVLLRELRSSGSLYEEDAVAALHRDFGNRYLYVDSVGHLSIRREVYDALRRHFPTAGSLSPTHQMTLLRRADRHRF